MAVKLPDGLIESIVAWLIAKLTAPKKPKPEPRPPVTVPTPREDPVDDFPDDTIPTKPNVGRVVSKVVIGIARAQYSRERFPEEYNEKNPFGLVPDSVLREVEKGTKALNFRDKIWLDLTAYDQDKREFVRAEVEALGLAFKTEHHCGAAYIIGHGADPKTGQPVGGYETNDADGVGNGISAWLSSNGFLHQMQVNEESDGLVTYGVVNGVKSNVFKIKVS